MLEQLFALFRVAQMQVTTASSFSCSLTLFSDGSGHMTYGPGDDDVTTWDDVEDAVESLGYFLVQFPKQATYPTLKEDTVS